MKKIQDRTKDRRGFTMPEMMVASAVSVFIGGALLIGSVTLQRSFMATDHYAVAQENQMRLMDYMAMDLRRATRVTPQASLGTGEVLEVWVPDFYLSNDPSSADYRTVTAPQRSPNGGVTYGGGGEIPIRYIIQGDEVFREEDGIRSPERSEAEDVADFIIELPQQTLDRVVKIEIRFEPRFQRPASESAIDQSAVHATVMMRNLGN